MISLWHCTVLQATAQYSICCSMCLHKSIFHFKQTSQQIMSPAWYAPMGSHRVQWALTSLLHQAADNDFHCYLHLPGTTKALIKLCSLSKRTKLLTENHPILHCLPCSFTSPYQKTEKQILFSFHPTSKKWQSTATCKLPFPPPPKQEGCIYLHHPEYPGHNLPSTKPGQHGDDPCGQQDAAGSGHAMNVKKIVITYDQFFLFMVVKQNFYLLFLIHTSLSETCNSSNRHILVYQRLPLSFVYAENSSSPFSNISVYLSDNWQKGYYIDIRILP